MQDLSISYPVGTPGSTSSSGYYHKLNPTQISALFRLQQWMEQNSYDASMLSQFSLHPSLTLLRYLRARNFIVEDAVKLASSSIEWRKQNKVNSLVWENPDKILGCPIHKMMEVFPHWHCGYDKSGRPVLFKQYAKFDVAKLKTMVGIDKLTRYHIWEQEHCMKLCLERSQKINMIVETTTAIMDLEGMKMSQVTSDFIAVIKALAQVDQNQYPETLGRLFIINTPSVFPFVWRMIKPFLDANTVAKISIYSSKKEWQPVLDECIGAENLPISYGGKLPPLVATIHPYAETMEDERIEKNMTAQIVEKMYCSSSSSSSATTFPDDASSDSRDHDITSPHSGLENEIDTCSATAEDKKSWVKHPSDGDKKAASLSENWQILILIFMYYVWILICATSLKSVATRLGDREKENISGSSWVFESGGVDDTAEEYDEQSDGGECEGDVRSAAGSSRCSDDLDWDAETDDSEGLSDEGFED